MMRIERIPSKPDRSGAYTVRFVGGTVLRLYRQTIEDFYLSDGKELTQEEYNQLCVAAGEMSAKMRAVRIVAATNVSKGDLQQRLIHKGESEADAANAVSWMEEMALLDDAETARQVVSQCIRKGYGKARAKQVLYEKRIPKDYWDDVLADYPDQSDFILVFLQKRLPADADEKQVSRTVDALLRRGHSYGTIKKVLNGYLENVQAFLED